MKPIIAKRRSVACDQYRASGEQRAIVSFAIQTCGYLLMGRVPNNEPVRFGFDDLADAIDESFASEKSREVSRTLRDVHALQADLDIA
jgi:hypothetical protein